MTAASIALALFGAVLFAVSAALQHHAAGVHGGEPAPVPVPVLDGTGLGALTVETVAPQRVRAPRRLLLLGRLMRDPWWLLGWAAGLTGFASQAVALHLGSIVVVQAIQVTQLIFALPLATVPAGRAPLLRDWLGSGSVCVGLAVLLAVRGTVPQTTGRRSEVWLVVAVAAVLILALLRASRPLDRYGRQYRTGAVGVAAGTCFCLTAVFLVLVGDDYAHHGLWGVVFDWPLYGLAASTLLGTVLVQDAFAGGSLPAAMTAMVITDPVASWIAGTVLFDARPTFVAGTLSGSAVAAGFIVLGVGALANSPTLRDVHRSPGTR